MDFGQSILTFEDVLCVRRVKCEGSSLTNILRFLCDLGLILNCNSLCLAFSFFAMAFIPHKDNAAPPVCSHAF